MRDEGEPREKRRREGREGKGRRVEAHLFFELLIFLKDLPKHILDVPLDLELELNVLILLMLLSFVAEEFDEGKHCPGSLSSLRLQKCSTWSFPSSDRHHRKTTFQTPSTPQHVPRIALRPTTSSSLSPSRAQALHPSLLRSFDAREHIPSLPRLPPALLPNPLPRRRDYRTQGS